MDKVISSQSGNTLKSDKQTDNVTRGGSVVAGAQTAVDQSSGGAGANLGMEGHSGASGGGFIPDPNPGTAFPGGGQKMGKISSRLGEA